MFLRFLLFLWKIYSGPILTEGLSYYELRVKIKDALLVRMVVGATGSRATRLDTSPTCGNNPPFTAWS